MKLGVISIYVFKDDLMVKAVNQCLLNQADFDFLTNANLVSELNDKLTIAERNLEAFMLFDFMVVVGAILIVVAFMTRYHSKGKSNVLIAVPACGVIFAGFMTYFNINKVETIKAEIVETNAALEAMA